MRKTLDSDSQDSNKTVLIKELKPNLSYVIVSYEGSYFPGLVVSLSKSKVRVKCMQRCGLTTWKWPAQDDLHSYSIAEIIKVVKTPSIANNRGTYFVPEVEKYWKM